ncbi:MAG: hypothetical protein IJW08_04330 [Lentisphaeria bacterium]|nr:hypothetical protein [Lentisphaeria bacterium]
MKELFFYDPMCSVGNDFLGKRSSSTPGDLLAEMDFYGIDKALVQYNNLAGAGAVYANKWIADFISSDTSNRLRGVWCLLPEQCGELPDDLFSAMSEKKICALTLDPFDHRWVAGKYSIGKIMAEAAERKIPVLMNYYNRKWEELYRFVETFPDNRLLIHDTTRHGTDRLVRPLLEYFPNVYYMLTAYWVPEGIRDLAVLYGADRLLYASCFPTYNHGSMMFALKNSGLDMASIAKIAGVNMQNLLEESWGK